jgi:membrane associated rhomboid family serine protease
MFPIRDTVPHRYLPVMTWLLIGANLAVFALELQLEPEQLRDLFALCGLVPARYTDPLFDARHMLPPRDYWPFLASMFLHGGWLHVIVNLWTLHIFGDNVEDHMGPLRFLCFYLLCGLLAGFLHLVTNPDSSLPTIGASGAIAGVMGAYFVLYPRARIVTLIPIFFWPLFVELPAVIYLGLWFFLQFQSGRLALAEAGDAGGVAWWAHVGGFLAGMTLLLLFVRRRGRRAAQVARG